MKFTSYLTSLRHGFHSQAEKAALRIVDAACTIVTACTIIAVAGITIKLVFA